MIYRVGWKVDDLKFDIAQSFWKILDYIKLSSETRFQLVSENSQKVLQKCMVLKK